MFLLAFLIAVAIVFGLTVLGALIATRNPGTDWEAHEDRPIIGPHHDH